MNDRKSPIPPRMTDGRGSGPDWGRLIAIVLVAALGSGGTAALGVNALTEYRLDQIEHEHAMHVERGAHPQAQRQLDRQDIAIEAINQRFDRYERRIDRSFDELKKLLEERPRRRR